MTSNPTNRAPRASGFFLRILDAVTALANVSGSLLILALVGLIAADVAGRNLFNKADFRGSGDGVAFKLSQLYFCKRPKRYARDVLPAATG